ncbi:hypothetical protein K438DRAFT_2067006 [Mycena galopus ATCC 62051]|nr:hypothetical protein K438DRAFT_2067006 [Mycena galopus ATCC 62051]
MEVTWYDVVGWSPENLRVSKTSLLIPRAELYDPGINLAQFSDANLGKIRAGPSSQYLDWYTEKNGINTIAINIGILTSICALLSHAPRLDGEPSYEKVYPTIVTEITDEHIVIEWFHGIYDNLPEGVERSYGVDRANIAAWDRAANMPLSLAHIEWPAHLTNSLTIFPSPLFPHQATLANTLYPWVPRLAAFFCGPQTDHPVDVWSYIDHRFVESNDPHHFCREFLGNVPGEEPFCGADETFFTTLGHQIRVKIYGSEHPHMPRSGTDVSNWIQGVARCIIATEVAAFYLNVDSLTAMMLLQERRVRRPMGTHERVLQAYAHAIRDEPEGAGRKLMEEVLVPVPGVAVPFPSAF